MFYVCIEREEGEYCREQFGSPVSVCADYGLTPADTLGREVCICNNYRIAVTHFRKNFKKLG